MGDNLWGKGEGNRIEEEKENESLLDLLSYVNCCHMSMAVIATMFSHTLLVLIAFILTWFRGISDILQHIWRCWSAERYHSVCADRIWLRNVFSDVCENVVWNMYASKRHVINRVLCSGCSLVQKEEVDVKTWSLPSFLPTCTYFALSTSVKSNNTRSSTYSGILYSSLALSWAYYK